MYGTAVDGLEVLCCEELTLAVASCGSYGEELVLPKSSPP